MEMINPILYIQSKIIAVVGASKNIEKAANRIPKYLQDNGYKIIPVNPTADIILEEPAKKSLDEITEPVDIVDIFRPADETPEIVRQAILLKPKLIWLQLGITNDEAKKIADSAGVSIIMDKCIKIEHARLM